MLPAGNAELADIDQSKLHGPDIFLKVSHIFMLPTRALLARSVWKGKSELMSSLGIVANSNAQGRTLSRIHQRSSYFT